MARWEHNMGEDLAAGPFPWKPFGERSSICPHWFASKTLASLAGKFKTLARL